MAAIFSHFPTLIVAALLSCELSQAAVVAVTVPVRLDSILGPHWEGYVDTEANTFVLNSWTEDRSAYWTPASSALPIVMPAVDNTGAPFDVPDNFSILGIGATWAFVGPDVGDIEWIEGVTLWGGQGYRVAWGASIAPGSRPIELDYSGDERIGGVALGGSFIGLRSTFNSVSIPEPNVGLLLVGGLTVLCWRRPTTRRSNSKKHGQNKALVGSADSASSSLRSGGFDPALPQL